MDLPVPSKRLLRFGAVFGLCYLIIALLLRLGVYAAHGGAPNADLLYAIPLMIISFPGRALYFIDMPLPDHPTEDQRALLLFLREAAFFLRGFIVYFLIGLLFSFTQRKGDRTPVRSAIYLFLLIPVLFVGVVLGVIVYIHAAA